jgi:hypothetical protein
MNVDDKMLSMLMGLIHGWTDAAVAMDGINSGALAVILLVLACSFSVK